MLLSEHTSDRSQWFFPGDQNRGFSHLLDFMFNGSIRCYGKNEVWVDRKIPPTALFLLDCLICPWHMFIGQLTDAKAYVSQQYLCLRWRREKHTVKKIVGKNETWESVCRLLTSGLWSSKNEVVLSAVCDLIDVDSVLPPRQKLMNVHWGSCTGKIWQETNIFYEDIAFYSWAALGRLKCNVLYSQSVAEQIRLCHVYISIYLAP